jgi:acetyl esterase/lipase
MRPIFLICALIGSFAAAEAQPTNKFSLWPNGAPGALGNADKDNPTLTPYFPAAAKPGTAAIIICPGGCYGFLAANEGAPYAQFLNENGVAAFVLKYRLGSDGYHYPVQLEDAARAVRFVRAHAAEWNLDPHRIGIMGSSAGGHLASTLLTHFDVGRAGAADQLERQSSRPDLGILCYPVITMGKFTSQITKQNLLGTNLAPELVRLVSNELQVASNTPPCYIWQTWEDSAVPVENSLLFADALREAGVPFDLHIYQKGDHGIGLGNRDPRKRHPWTAALIYWLKAQGWTR